VHGSYYIVKITHLKFGDGFFVYGTLGASQKYEANLALIFCILTFKIENRYGIIGEIMIWKGAMSVGLSSFIPCMATAGFY
jgi:hypothetical protein